MGRLFISSYFKFEIGRVNYLYFIEVFRIVISISETKNKRIKINVTITYIRCKNEIL